jgi:hypothetical protein
MSELFPASKGGISVGLTLNEQEEYLVEETESYLERIHSEENILVRQRFAALKSLGAAISLFPSVREIQTVRGEVRDEKMLLESLCDFAPSSRLLHIPTRIITTRSFLVAKCHAFSLLALLAEDQNILYSRIRRTIFSIICTLMTEEVYFSCLEDPVFSQDIKRHLADDLIALWESGTDPLSVQHLPALEALWTARDNAPPCFGTMDGSSELLRISIDLGKDWQEFLIKYTGDEETCWALEEFLFGLSYEEIKEVRSRLVRFGIMAVGHDEVRSYLGSCPAYTIVRNSDPRAVYDFYIDRRDTAAFRRRTASKGPRRTLEEMYLKFRIAQEY